MLEKFPCHENYLCLSESLAPFCQMWELLLLRPGWIISGCAPFLDNVSAVLGRCVSSVMAALLCPVAMRKLTTTPTRKFTCMAPTPSPVKAAVQKPLRPARQLEVSRLHCYCCETLPHTCSRSTPSYLHTITTHLRTTDANHTFMGPRGCATRKQLWFTVP